MSTHTPTFVYTHALTYTATQSYILRIHPPTRTQVTSPCHKGVMPRYYHLGEFALAIKATNAAPVYECVGVHECVTAYAYEINVAQA